MQTYRIDWARLPWIAPMPGVRFKVFEQNERRLRLAEFTPEFREPQWCHKGHIGYVLDGKGELQFSQQTVQLKEGDGIFIPPGVEHKHRLHVLSGGFRIVLVEALEAPETVAAN